MCHEGFGVTVTQVKSIFRMEYSNKCIHVHVYIRK